MKHMQPTYISRPVYTLHVTITPRYEHTKEVKEHGHRGQLIGRDVNVIITTDKGNYTHVGSPTPDTDAHELHHRQLLSYLNNPESPEFKELGKELALEIGVLFPVPAGMWRKTQSAWKGDKGIALNIVDEVNPPAPPEVKVLGVSAAF